MAELELCDWPVTLCDECCTDEVEQLDPETWELLQRWAADYLWRATGRVYGLCSRTYRPCRRNCDGSFGFGLGTPFIPWRINGDWINLSCRTCPGECGCGGRLSEIRLANVNAVTALRIDGVDEDPSGTVAVYDRNRIVRIDGEEFPGCQNLAQLDGIGTWSITIEQGIPVPPGGALAAGILACEFAKACLGSDDCRLPQRTQIITRQGVTVGFQDRFENLADMLTGIFEIDTFITAARSNRFGAPSIASVDRPRAARLTWPIVETP
ncbi:MAG TPA: hypothetical protein VF062_00060 [Candidatus Limnocylindrales bacterium]